MDSVIGGRRVVASDVFFIPKGNHEYLEYNKEFIEQDKVDSLRMKFRFIDDPEAPAGTKGQMHVAAEVKDGVGCIDIYNSNGTFIIPNGPPAPIGYTEAKSRVTFMAKVEHFNSYIKLEIQITLGVGHEGP